MQRKIFAFLLVVLFCGLSSAETIKLPLPKAVGTMSLEEAIYRRRSERSFLPNPLTKEQLSQLLWSCQGITDPQWDFRSAPSAGSLYPLEIYAVNQKGVYHYIPAKNTLIRITAGDKRQALARAALAQTSVGEAPVIFVVTAVFDRTRAKYGSRSPRYVVLEAGHAAQNLILQATALGLGAVTVGSFWDDVVASTLRLPVECEPLYLIPVGYKKK